MRSPLLCSLNSFPIQWILRSPSPPRRTWRFSECSTVISTELLNASCFAATSNALLLPTVAATAAAFRVLSPPHRRLPRSDPSADYSRERRRAVRAAFPLLLLPAVEMAALEPETVVEVAVLAGSPEMLISNWLETRLRSFRHFHPMLSFSMFRCELFTE